ncbi:hypothetical protein Bca52824_031153 [Brassica carinata]|uniref:Reverse transcriptase zinc-binding domain-containing protein n=1 Tax=Brassica carinata TaxID=52824 RepID=A0A8X7SAQ6_BRACI|nr:hypothetical protein Bca52824_031153 [Brassica carinata]
MAIYIMHFEALHAGRLISSRSRGPTLLILRENLPPQLPLFNSPDPDVYIWRNNPQDPLSSFSISKVWNYLHPKPAPLPCFAAVWFKQRIPKHAFITWLSFRGRLATRDRLRSWGIQVPQECLLCGVAPENRDHMFLGCVYSQEVWKSFFHRTRLRPPIAVNAISLDRFLFC